MQLISQSETKKILMENSHVMVEFYWRQKQQQVEAHYIENTQLHEDNQLEEKHPDVCDEESEERIQLFCQSLAKDDIKKKKSKIKHKECEHT